MVTALVVVNVGMNRGLPSWSYVPWAVGWTVALVGFAHRVDGRSWSDLGLARADVPTGLRWGAVLGGGHAVALDAEAAERADADRPGPALAGAARGRQRMAAHEAQREVDVDAVLDGE